MKRIIVLILSLSLSYTVLTPASSTFYVSSSEGNDGNNGLTPATPWQTLSKVNAQGLLPGDSVLFRSGDIFIGRLSILNESGTAGQPIVLCSYGVGARPLIDGDGYLSSIQIRNSGYIHLHDLEITNERAQSQPGVSEDLRYGIYIENSFSDGTTFDHYRFHDLSFRNIYPTSRLTDDDKLGVNAHAITTTGSWGDDIHPVRFRDMHIENCFFTGIGRHAVVLRSVEGLALRNNLFQHVGGAGIVIGAKCKNVLVEHNTTDHTGSTADSRMAGRGSGLWCFNSKNVVVQHNKFMYASGIKDSYGMHIDHSNRNVVYQYNYSEGNEGGFVEILGNNVNVGYRYNVSVGDGWRKRGPTFGKVFWFTGWAGDPENPIPSDSVFVYNNSVFIPDTIEPGITIKEGMRCRIYNNIIYASNGFGDVVIDTDPENIDFNYNLWYGPIPEIDTDGRAYRGPQALILDPRFKDSVITDSTGFLLQEDSPAIRAGKLIFDSNVDHPFDYYVNHGGKDFYGNPVSEISVPNMGAWNGDAISVILNRGTGYDPFTVYPNPFKTADHKIKLCIPGKEDYGDASIWIFDSQGRMVLNKKFNEYQELQVSPGYLSRGNYFIRVQLGTDLYTFHLLVI